MVLKFYLVACLLLLVLSLIPGSKAIGNADGTGSNGSFIPTRNEQVSVPINITQEKITSSLIGNLMGLNLIPNKIPTSVIVGKVRLFPMSFLLGIINSQFWKLV